MFSLFGSSNIQQGTLQSHSFLNSISSQPHNKFHENIMPPEHWLIQIQNPTLSSGQPEPIKNLNLNALIKAWLLYSSIATGSFSPEELSVAAEDEYKWFILFFHASIPNSLGCVGSSFVLSLFCSRFYFMRVVAICGLEALLGSPGTMYSFSLSKKREKSGGVRISR